MRNILYSFVLLAVVAGPVSASENSFDSCEQIRARIDVAPVADARLLRALAIRKDCRFSFHEIYRSAYGDRRLSPAGLLLLQELQEDKARRGA